MKSANPGFLTAATSQFGTQTNVAVVINWPGFGSHTYSDIQGLNENRLLSIGSIHHELRNTQVSTMTTTQVTLDDFDGFIRNVLNSFSVEGALVSIYLLLDSNWILLMLGRIIGGVSWSEGKRTISLGIETNLKSRDVGFAPVATDFTDLTPDAVGLPWPICFGSPVHVKAPRVRQKGTNGTTMGTTETINRFGFYPPIMRETTAAAHYEPFLDHTKVQLWDIGKETMVNPNLWGQFRDVIHLYSAPNVPLGTMLYISVDGVLFKGAVTAEVTTRRDYTFSSFLFTVTERNVSKYLPITIIPGPRTTESEKKDSTIVYIDVPEGHNIPQLENHHIYYTNGADMLEPDNRCNYITKQEGKKLYLLNTFYQSRGGTVQNKVITSGQIIFVGVVSYYGTMNTVELYLLENTFNATKRVTKENLDLSQYASIEDIPVDWYVSLRMNTEAHYPKLGFKSFGAGTKVSFIRNPYVEVEDPDIYLCNLLPSTGITAVYGVVKDVNDGHKNKLQQIPEKWYTTEISSGLIDGRHVSGILFLRSLKEWDALWDDSHIYVTFTSSVGPNAADILKYIIENYTDHIVDNSAYLNCQSKATDFPCNFALYDITNAWSIIETIAFQARIGLVIDCGIIYFKPLYYPPVSVLTLTTEDIVFKSIEQSSTSLGSAIRKLTATWKPDDAPVFNSELGNKHKYETTFGITDAYTVNRTERIQCTIYNNPTLVATMVNFWGYRKTRSWRTYTAKSFYLGSILQPLDGCILDTDQTPGIMGTIQGLTIDLNNHEVTLDLWYPIVAGEPQ